MNPLVLINKLQLTNNKFYCQMFLCVLLFVYCCFMLAHFILPHKKNNHRAHLLKPVALYTMLAFMLGLQLFFSFIGKMDPAVLGITHSITNQDIVALTNDERGKLGLPALSMNGALSVAAQKKGEDMLAKGYWAHVAPDGKQPWAFMREAGYSYERAGENLAKDFTDSTSAVRAWMNSPGHRANIVNVYYREIGVAVVSGTMNGRDTVIVVQMFGQPRGGLASIQQAQSAQAASTPKPEPKGISVVEEIVPDEEKTQQERPTTSLIADNGLVIEPVEDTSSPLINPFQINKTVSFVIVVILLTLLIADAVYVARNRIIHQKHGHSTLHIIFIVSMMIALLLTSSGVIL